MENGSYLEIFPIPIRNKTNLFVGEPLSALQPTLAVMQTELKSK